jgi:putative ABC transport system substrate-binding protein
MRRREFITLLGGAAAVPVLSSVTAQPMPIIGFLGGESPALSATPLRIFHEGLKETGFVEGKNVAIEYRWAEGHNDRLPALAADLVERQVNVIVAPGTTPAALAAKAATKSIPIVVFTGADPVALGLVASLARPGGNVTGTTSFGIELAAKRLGLLHELLPDATVMAVLVNPTNPVFAEFSAKAAQEAARSRRLTVHVLTASTEAEFDGVFTTMRRVKASALVIAIDSFFTGRRQQLGELALRHGVPAIYQYRDFAEAGGIMSYGGSLTDPYRLVGIYTGRILKGEKPADLPVQQITRIELVINLKAAKSLGVSVPPTLAALADEVIE